MSPVLYYSVGVLECWCAGTNVGADCIRPKVSQGLI